MVEGSTPEPAAVLLWWIPVGAGGHVVRRTSRWWERAHAALAGRPERRLFHAALEVTVDGSRTVVEMAPAWGGPAVADRGVVRTGPVGARFLGRSRLFRYEVRCWRGGTIPDLAWAEGGATRITEEPDRARALLAQVREVPALTWGRPVAPFPEMWNSNSVIAWAVLTAGLDGAALQPPEGGWAPGWDTGVGVARAGLSTS